MASKTVLILGGGVGGLVTANELRRALPPEHRVVVVEKNARHAFPAAFLWLMTGDRKPEQVTRSVTSLVRPGVEVVEAEVESLDLKTRKVSAGEHQLVYDYLIIALGAELAPETIPGLAEAAHTFYTFEGAQKLHQALEAFQGGSVAVVVSTMPYKCPGAPYEAAMLVADFLHQRGREEQTTVNLFTPEPGPLPVAGAELGAAVTGMLTDKGIQFHSLHGLKAVDPQKKELSFANGVSSRYDLLAAVPPHRAPRFLRQTGLTNEGGWIPVDRSTLATETENVYALGDVTAVSIPGRWKSDMPLALPKAGVFAHGEGLIVARRIAGEILATPDRPEFRGDGFCMLEAGENLAGFAYGDFYAQPAPEVHLRQVGKLWHLGKVLFEKWWLAPYGLRRNLLGLTLKLGGRTLGIPIEL